MNLPLQRFSAVRSRDVDEVHGWMRSHLAVDMLDLRDRERVAETVLNNHPLSSVQLTFIRYGVPVTAGIAHAGFFAQGFPLKGDGRSTRAGQTRELHGGRSGVAIGPGSAEVVFEYNRDFEHLVLHMPPAALTRTLAAIIDRPVDPPLRLDENPVIDPSHGGLEYRLVRFLASEVDCDPSAAFRPAMAELEQAAMVAFLFATGNNYSHWLRKDVREAAPWQVRRAVDYIEAHWDQPITIDALAMVARTSARSLFLMFNRKLGMSPMAYVRQVRLRHAKAMLSRPDGEVSVTSVVYRCGFSNMGHFAKAYFAAFGEKPSDTLRTHH